MPLGDREKLRRDSEWYRCEGQVSLDELIEDGWDVAEGTEALGNFVVPGDDDEGHAQ